MSRVILAGLRARTGRLLFSAIAIAIALAVAFVTGARVLDEAVGVGLRAELAGQARNVDASITAGLHGNQTSNPLNDEVLRKVRQIPGVAAAEGRLTVQAPLVGVTGRASDAAATALPADPLLRPYELVEGRYPETDREVTLDRRTATESGYRLGQPVRVLTEDGQQREFTLVGTFRPAVPGSQLGTGRQLLLRPDALRLLTPDGSYSEIVARATSGTDQRQLVDQITRTLDRSDLVVMTGAAAVDQLLAQTAPQTPDFARFFSTFALIALAVAAMVIYNTFGILVTQRTRELALLRCVGASKRQVFTGVLAEAAATGAVASMLGLFGGVGLAALLQLLIGAFGVEGEAAVHTPVTTRTVLLAGAVGVLVTMAASLVPAYAATRVAPVAALRTRSDGPTKAAHDSRLRSAVTALLALTGTGLAVFGLEAGAERGVALIGLCLLALLGAALAAGPLLVGPIVRTLGGVPRRLAGTPGLLACTNATRNPRRTAATAAALMLGLTVVALITTVVATAGHSVEQAIDRQYPVDYTLTSAVPPRPLPPALLETISTLDEVAVAAPSQSLGVDLGPAGGYWLTAVDGRAIGSLLRPGVLDGQLDRLGPDELAISRQLADETGLAVNQTLPVSTRHGRVDMRVTAIYDSVDGPDIDLGLGLMDLTTLDTLDPSTTGYQNIMVKMRPGIGLAEGRSAIEQAVSGSPLTQLASSEDLKKRAAEQFQQLLGYLWALIGLAVVIALAGIGNTLSLSVLERTRESALLRALGLTRGQLRATLMIESVLIALMGAALGLVLGVGSAWLISRVAASSAMPMTMTVPFGQLGLALATTVLAAPLATLLPARRAARRSITAGMAEP
ncbi:FtsX-like permease family protein [Micromonospora sonneratiae]|uniref:ABC transporter permease n=1 Tax=Micromonospora sonneratiae TaxID=1184706 RepID=A0ABW3Y625_9ACTN